MQFGKLPVFIAIVIVFLSGCVGQPTNNETSTPYQTPAYEYPTPQETSTPPTPYQTPAEPPKEDQTKSKVKEFTIVAKQFQFDITDSDGNTVVNKMEVNKGDAVKLTITSSDVTHGFALNEFGINEVLNAGDTVAVEFVADKTGSFGFFCSVFCGSGHSDMKGVLTVS